MNVLRGERSRLRKKYYLKSADRIYNENMCGDLLSGYPKYIKIAIISHMSEIIFKNRILVNCTIKKLGEDRALDKLTRSFNDKKEFKNRIMGFLDLKINFYVLHIYRTGFVVLGVPETGFLSSYYNLKMEPINFEDADFSDEDGNLLGIIRKPYDEHMKKSLISIFGCEYEINRLKTYNGLFII